MWKAEVRGAGWQVAMTDQKSFGHATVYRLTEPTDIEIERITEVFTDPQINQGTEDEFR